MEKRGAYKNNHALTRKSSALLYALSRWKRGGQTPQEGLSGHFWRGCASPEPRFSGAELAAKEGNFGKSKPARRVREGEADSCPPVIGFAARMPGRRSRNWKNRGGLSRRFRNQRPRGGLSRGNGGSPALCKATPPAGCWNMSGDET